ncbi:MAG TPA: hypothetical protein EYM95_20095 [Candidatus Obscuribacterales bacterium]|nr:hypothetical protein [Candidatus Obscuribacterales bacterium]
MYKFDEPSLSESAKFSNISRDLALPVESEDLNWLGSDAFSALGRDKGSPVASATPETKFELDNVVSSTGKLENIAPVAPKETDLLGAAAKSAVQTAINNPLETGGTALLALLALRFKAPIVEEMAQAAAGLENFGAERFWRSAY